MRREDKLLMSEPDCLRRVEKWLHLEAEASKSRGTHSTGRQRRAAGERHPEEGTAEGHRRENG